MQTWAPWELKETEKEVAKKNNRYVCKGSLAYDTNMNNI